MTNWHNELLREEGWFDYIFDGDEEKLNDEKAERERSANKCEFCGTRTGLHSFSFNSEGRY